MTIQEYQNRALATAIYDAGDKIIYPGFGLSSEAGEVAGKIKQVLRDKRGFFDDNSKLELAKEIGDCLWYCNALANDIGYSLESIMELNIQKLESRKERNVIHGSGDNR